MLPLCNRNTLGSVSNSRIESVPTCKTPPLLNPPLRTPDLGFQIIVHYHEFMNIVVMIMIIISIIIIIIIIIIIMSINTTNTSITSIAITLDSSDWCALSSGPRQGPQPREREGVFQYIINTVCYTTVYHITVYDIIVYSSISYYVIAYHM